MRSYRASSGAGDPAGDLGAGGRVLRGAVGDVGQGVVAQLLGPLQVGPRLLQPRLRRGQRRLGHLQALHELELLVLQVGLPPLQRRELVLEVGHLLRRDAARVQQLLVLLLAGPHRLDVGLHPLDLTAEVARPRSRPARRRRTRVRSASSAASTAATSGRVRPRCASCVRATSSAASSRSFCCSKWSTFTRSTYRGAHGVARDRRALLRRVGRARVSEALRPLAHRPASPGGADASGSGRSRTVGSSRSAV